MPKAHDAKATSIGGGQALRHKPGATTAGRQVPTPDEGGIASNDMAESSKAISLASEIGEALVARNWTLSTAESCTGGLVSHHITNVPGSSAFFVGGIIAYANRVKQGILGVPQSLLIAHGAVSGPVASAMAQGVRRVLRTEVGIAVTGIAGPTGGTPEKPVGTVFLALSSPAGNDVAQYTWDLDREGNKQLSAEALLDLLAKHLGL